MDNQKRIGQTTDKPALKVYAAPVLVEYGNISKLTQGGGSVTTDGGALMM